MQKHALQAKLLQSFVQVISLKNVESIGKLPKEIKEYALSINFVDGTARMFACESGENGLRVFSTEKLRNHL